MEPVETPVASARGHAVGLAPPPAGKRSAMLPGAALVVLVVAWIVAGLVGHDPWKPDEAYTFGVALEFLERRDWIVPWLAGEVFLEKPPLFFITAAGFARLFAPFLPLHDAARLACGFYVAWALVFLALSARELYGERRGATALLVMIGCLGLLVRSHQLVTDLALLAGMATGTYGLARARRSAWVGGVALGVGGLMAFLAKGLLGPGLLGLTAVALLLFPAWRRRAYLHALALGSVILLSGAAAWVIPLYRRSPAYVYEWLVLNNFGRFASFANLSPPAPYPGFYAVTLLWHAFPALPLAAWTLWNAGRDRPPAWSDPTLQLPAVMVVVTLAVLSAAHDARELYLLPALIPLALLAVARIDRLPPRAAALAERFSLWAAIVPAGVLWLSWLSMVTGFPAGVDELVAAARPGFTPTVVWSAVTGALVVTGIWVYVVRRRQRAIPHFVVRWAAATTLCWTLAMTLWLPFIDAGKSYRTMIDSLAQAMPTGTCIASRNLGEPQRALLKYFAGIVTVRQETSPGSTCDALLVQGWPGWQGRDGTAPDFGGSVVWEGMRPGSGKEIYRLYVKGAPDLPPKRFPAGESAWAGETEPLLSAVARSLRRLAPNTAGKARS